MRVMATCLIAATVTLTMLYVQTILAVITLVLGYPTSPARRG